MTIPDPTPVKSRLRRAAPARPGPRRALFPGAEDTARTEAPDPGGDPGIPVADTVVAKAVNAAYRVVEDNIQEGRRAAERLRAAVHAPAAETGGAKAAANRLMHVTKELGATWVDLIVAVLGEADVRAFLDRMASHDRSPARPAGAHPSTVSITHRVSSRRPVEVTLSPLAAFGRATAPAIGGLHALDPGAPPILGVGFGTRADGALELELHVPDTQPADIYSGVVVDGETRTPLGTLMVRVLE